ncbi:hypothetical protein [Cryptosporangium minutisporangium]|uniref:Uncharacterized protein n=1 Tax=Cryptosporangium minutisporangium TaxID=113569 RepID=A0ABP6T0N5_9ACTN
MAYRYDSVLRLEPAHPYSDLTRGLRAEIADPVWFLGRQWQLGEHRGEDAASPVRVEYRAERSPIRPFDADPRLDPRSVPTEAIVESEPDEFWTVGRRVTVGRGVERAAADAGRPLPDDDALRLADLAPPYDLLNGAFDGRVLFRDRAQLELPEAWFPESPPRPAPRDLWNSAELAYDADFTAGPATLALRRHDGGTVDWWSVDATAPVPDPARPPDVTSVVATRIQYPGAPNPRWWQIEESAADLGAYDTDRSHFGTLLLVELISSHSDDWYTFPIVAPVGSVLTLHEVTVIDSTGEPWVVRPPDDGWTMFTVTGLDPRSLVVWSTVTTALTGSVLDQVDLGVDEDANLVWAVERRVGGRDLLTPQGAEGTGGTDAAGTGADATAAHHYTYVPGADVPAHWHPYLVDEERPTSRLLVQARLADLAGVADRPGRRPPPMPAPITTLLRPTPGGGERIHSLQPSAVPVDGLQIERRYQLGRRVDGEPVLWLQRRRLPLAAPPTMRLRFDALEEE